jgi:ribosome recycling factor
MTSKEQETIDKLYKLMAEIQKENNEFRKQINNITTDINTKVDIKHLPITLEQDILSIAQQSIQKAIQESMTKYDSPLIKLVTSVVNEHSTELRGIISDSFNEVIKKDEFKASIRAGFSHKVARTIISNNDGLFDKVSNELKQDAVFKSKMALAVANVVNECLEERSK